MNTQKKETWVSRNLTNLLCMALIALIVAFFSDFSQWKGETREWRLDTEKRLNLLEQGVMLHDWEIREIRKDIDKLWTDRFGTSRGGSPIKR